MEPIPETAAAVNELDPEGDAADDLMDLLTTMASRAKVIVPDLVGVSIARLDEGLTFTLVASAAEIAALDAVQYAAGGPCVEGAHSDEVLEFHPGDALNEKRWHLFAEATAAHTVRSTLTLPVVHDGRVEGTVNLYAASRRAFTGHHAQLAEIFGAFAAGAMANADLSFATRQEAESAPQRIRDRVLVDVAVGILAEELRVDVATAEDTLRNAAARAGVTETDLAREMVRARDRTHHDDPDSDLLD